MSFFRRVLGLEPSPLPDPSDLALTSAAGVAATGWLNDEHRDRLAVFAQALLDEFEWEAANGFELTDEIRGTIAAHAALLVLELGLECYDDVSSVIVHPTSFETHGEWSMGGGVVSNTPLGLDGEANHHGPILIAWDAARREARHPEHGHNVVFHEFAHHLDLLDGWADGTPPLPDQAARDRWIEVCTDAFERLSAGDDGGVLDGYGAVNPSEFFAVATEVFFARPIALRGARPELYEVLADFYRLDPAVEAGSDAP